MATESRISPVFHLPERKSNFAQAAYAGPADGADVRNNHGEIEDAEAARKRIVGPSDGDQDAADRDHHARAVAINEPALCGGQSRLCQHAGWRVITVQMMPKNSWLQRDAMVTRRG
jgi:hypothetical protein